VIDIVIYALLCADIKVILSALKQCNVDLPKDYLVIVSSVTLQDSDYLVQKH